MVTDELQGEHLVLGWTVYPVLDPVRDHRLYSPLYNLCRDPVGRTGFPRKTLTCPSGHIFLADRFPSDTGPSNFKSGKGKG